MKCLIVNADDFGASFGINRGIILCHTDGVVTSASLLVDGPAARDAARLSGGCPDLAIGLHWDVWGEGTRDFDVDDEVAVRQELARQLDVFGDLIGRQPTHIDSHRHAHLKSRHTAVFEEFAAEWGVPLRGDGQVRFVGHFYAQWEWLVTNLDHISVPALETLINTDVTEGWTEFSCHPGFVSADFESIYRDEREIELRTLLDPRIRRALEVSGVELRSFADFGRRMASRQDRP